MGAHKVHFPASTVIYIVQWRYKAGWWWWNLIGIFVTMDTDFFRWGDGVSCLCNWRTVEYAWNRKSTSWSTEWSSCHVSQRAFSCRSHLKKISSMLYIDINWLQQLSKTILQNRMKCVEMSPQRPFKISLGLSWKYACQACRKPWVQVPISCK